jgi:hypothetical protein
MRFADAGLAGRDPFRICFKPVSDVRSDVMYAMPLATLNPTLVAAEKSSAGSKAAQLGKKATSPSSSSKQSSSPPTKLPSSPAASIRFRSNLSSWLAKGEAAVASARDAVSSIHGSVPGHIAAGSCATSPKVLPPFLNKCSACANLFHFPSFRPRLGECQVEGLVTSVPVPFVVDGALHSGTNGVAAVPNGI